MENFQDYNKQLTVSDQPGMKIFLIGLIFSMVVGLIFRGITSPDRIYKMVEQASHHVHRDVKIKFDSAELKLSDGIFPRIFVLIKNVSMQAEEPCWYRPNVRIENIELPVSIIKLIRRVNPITKIYADQVSFYLYGKKEECQPIKPQVEKNNQTPQAFMAMPKSSEVVDFIEQNSDSSDIQNIQIRLLKFRAVAYMENPIEIQNLNFQSKSQHPRDIILRAKSNLFRDEQMGDYLSHSNIYIEFKEQPEPTIQASIYGNLREGVYSINLKYTHLDQDLISDIEIKHAPVQVITELMNKWGYNTRHFEPRQMWLSMKSHSEGFVGHYQDSPLFIKDIKVVGETGDVAIPQVTIESFSPLKISPTQMMVNNINLDKILDILNLPKTKQTLGALGVLSGVLKYEEPLFQFSGQLKGLEFIFANKGQREVQRINNLNISSSKNKNLYKFNLQKFELNNGELQADVKLQHDENKKQSIVQVRIDNLRLAPEVQKLITNEGELNQLNGNLQLQVLDQNIKSLAGQVNLNKTTIENMTFEKLKSNLSFKNNQIYSQVTIDSVKLTTGSPGFQFFLKTGVLQNHDELILHKVAAQIHTDNFSTLSWENLVSQFEAPPYRLVSSGGWNQKGELHGSLKLISGKKENIWKILGHRDEIKLK